MGLRLRTAAGSSLGAKGNAISEEIRKVHDFHTARLNGNMDDDLDCIGMLQRKLGEAYYRLERVGLQATGDLSDIAEMAWATGLDLRAMLMQGEKRELCGRPV